jgi:hypothetical protein
MVVRGKVKLSPPQIKMLIEMLPFVAPKMSAVAVGYLSGEDFAVPKELPPKLLTLVSKIDAVEGNYLSRYAPPVEPRSVGPSGVWFLCT